MTSSTSISEERMTHYLRTGRRLHGVAVVAALKFVGRAMAKLISGLGAHRGRHNHSHA